MQRARQATSSLFTAWRRKFETNPSSVPVACLGGCAWTASVRYAPRRVPRLATPRRRWLPYPGGYVKTVKTVKTALKTDCETGENRENRHMPLK